MKKIRDKEKKQKLKRGISSEQLRKEKLLKEIRELRATLPFIENIDDISKYKVLGRP